MGKPSVEVVKEAEGQFHIGRLWQHYRAGQLSLLLASSVCAGLESNALCTFALEIF